MLRHHKKKLVVLLLCLATVMAAWFVFAAYSKKWLEGRINVLIADLREKGSTISYSAFDIRVSPLSVQATIQNPHLQNPKALVDWQGREVTIFMRPWDRFTLHFIFSGEQALVVPKLFALPLGVLHLEDATGTLHFTSQGKPERLTFTVNHLSSLLGDHPQPVTFQDFSVNISHMTDPLNLKLSFSTQVSNMEKLVNKEPRAHPFMVNLVADLSGFKPERSFPKTLTEWRDGGGVIEIRLLKIDWPPILAEAEGTLTLDEEMYPLGSFSSRITGYEQALNDMVELGWIKKKKVTMALFLLDLLSSPNEQGEKHLKAPLTLQNKKFSVGPVPLLKLQPIGEQ